MKDKEEIRNIKFEKVYNEIIVDTASEKRSDLTNKPKAQLVTHNQVAQVSMHAGPSNTHTAADFKDFPFGGRGFVTLGMHLTFIIPAPGRQRLGTI